MSEENLKDKDIRINLLDLDDSTLNLLSKARYLGLISENASLDKLANGVQSVLSFGKEVASKEFPEGIYFTLSPEDKELMDNMIANLSLVLDPFIQIVDDALKPKGDIFRSDATIQEIVADVLRTALVGNKVSIGDIKETSQKGFTITRSVSD